MTATLRTNPESLGIGTTAPAFNKGLASLEALVAAVEVCLRTLYFLPRRPTDSVPN
jgi:hypothetical protein